MSFEKSSPERIASFDAALPDDPRIQKKKMFGYPAAFVNGNFFAGLHEENVVMRPKAAKLGPLLAAALELVATLEPKKPKAKAKAKAKKS